MIKYLSEKIATYVCSGDESADYEVLVYGYDLFLQEIGVVLITLLLALPFGVVTEVLVSIVAYNLLRRFAGGTHAKHRIVCIITSVLVMFGPSLFYAKTGLHLSLLALAALFVVDCLILLRYAPADTDTKPVQNPVTRKRMRGTALVILCGYLLLCVPLYLWRADFASLVMTVATIVCCLTLPAVYRLYGCRRSEQEAPVK